MSELLAKFDGGELIGLAAVIGTFFCAIPALALAFYAHWTTHRRNENLAALKHDMLNRGMSAEQIQFVLDAGMPDARKAFARPACRA